MTSESADGGIEVRVHISRRKRTVVCERCLDFWRAERPHVCGGGPFRQHKALSQPKGKMPTPPSWLRFRLLILKWLLNHEEHEVHEEKKFGIREFRRCRTPILRAPSGRAQDGARKLRKFHASCPSCSLW